MSRMRWGSTEMETKFVFKRSEGTGSLTRITLGFDLDLSDQVAQERLAEILKALVPQDEREEFIAGFLAEAERAGFVKESAPSKETSEAGLIREERCQDR